jgi:tetratricopeptide (TPR) repeat protein
MLKRIPLFISLLAFSAAFSQQVTLKKTLDKSDYAFLDKELMDCLRPDNQLRFSYSSSDLFEPTGKPQLPANEETVKTLKKKIKDNPKDIAAYNELAAVCKRMRRYSEAEEYLNKAIALLQEKIKMYPDSTDAYTILGSAYLASGRYDESLNTYARLISINPKDNAAPEFISFLLMSTNRFDSASAFIARRIQQYPDDFDSYTILPVFYFYSFMKKLNDTGFEGQVGHINTETAISMPLLLENFEKNRKDVKVEFRCQVARQIFLSSFLMVKCFYDLAFDANHIKFRLSADDLARLDAGQKYFEECLKRKDIVNKYFPNKLLGSICMLRNDFKKAAPYFQKAIALKSKNKQDFSNGNEDYDNLLSVYMISGDTASYLKWLDEKIKNSDPDPQDDLKLARIKLAKGKLTEAASTYSIIIEKFGSDAAAAEAWLGLAHINYLQGKLKESTVLIDKAYALNKSNWLVYIFYGIISMRENDAPNAYELFNIAKKLHPRKWIDEELLNKYFTKP